MGFVRRGLVAWYGDRAVPLGRRFWREATIYGSFETGMSTLSVAKGLPLHGPNSIHTRAFSSGPITRSWPGWPPDYPSLPHTGPKWDQISITN